MHISAVVQDICSHFNLGVIDIGSKERFSMVFNDEITVNFEVIPHTQSFCVFSFLFPTLSEQQNRQICRTIMSENSFGTLYGNIVISLSESNFMFVASQTFSMQFYHAESFLQVFEMFLTTVTKLKNRSLSQLTTKENISDQQISGFQPVSFLKY